MFAPILKQTPRINLICCGEGGLVVSIWRRALTVLHQGGSSWNICVHAIISCNCCLTSVTQFLFVMLTTYSFLRLYFWRRIISEWSLSLNNCFLCTGSGWRKVSWKICTVMQLLEDYAFCILVLDLTTVWLCFCQKNSLYEGQANQEYALTFRMKQSEG